MYCWFEVCEDKNGLMVMGDIYGGESFLFLMDEQLCQGIEVMYFVYCGFIVDLDWILVIMVYGCVYYCVIYFINCVLGMIVINLFDILGVMKQFFNCVLCILIEDGLVESYVGKIDKCECNLYLIEEGVVFEVWLFDVQRVWMWVVYCDVGLEVVVGFWWVLEVMMDIEMCCKNDVLRDGGF